MIRRLACTAALLLLAAPSVAEARTVSVVGSLGLSHFDPRSGASSGRFWALDTHTRLVRLEPRGVDPAGLAGRRVRATGELLGGRLVVHRSGLVALGGRSELRAAGASSIRPTAVVILRFPDAPDNPSYTPTASDARKAIFGSAAADPYSVRQYYLTQTYGQVKLGGKVNPAGDVFGPYNVPNPSHDPGCQFGDWSNTGAQAVQAHDHVDVNTYSSVIYLFVTSRCSFAGVGTQPGSSVWINGLNRYTVDHELGHTFGNPHASSLRCHSGAVVVTLSTTCDPYDEYGDPFDPMGSGGTPVASQGYESIAHEMEPWRKLHIGSIKLKDTPTANTPGKYHLAPLERSSGVRMLRLPDGRGDGRVFDLSFRRPLGVFDSTYLEPNTGNPKAVSGVVINWDKKALTGDNSLLLDTTPNTTGGTVDPFTHQTTTGFEDAPLAAGRSFTDARTALTATVKSVGNLGAEVTIAYGRGVVDVATPTVPGRPTAKVSHGKVTLTWAAAHDAFGVTGYIVSRNGHRRSPIRGLKATDKPGHGKFKYTVRAVDAAGNVSPPSQVRVVTIGKKHKRA